MYDQLEHCYNIAKEVIEDRLPNVYHKDMLAALLANYNADWYGPDVDEDRSVAANRIISYIEKILNNRFKYSSQNDLPRLFSCCYAIIDGDIISHRIYEHIRKRYANNDKDYTIKFDDNGNEVIAKVYIEADGMVMIKSVDYPDDVWMHCTPNWFIDITRGEDTDLPVKFLNILHKHLSEANGSINNLFKNAEG